MTKLTDHKSTKIDSEILPSYLFYSISTTCRILSLGRTTVYNLAKEKILERRKQGRRSLISKASVDRYAASLGQTEA